MRLGKPSVLKGLLTGLVNFQNKVMFVNGERSDYHYSFFDSTQDSNDWVSRPTKGQVTQ